MLAWHVKEGAKQKENRKQMEDIGVSSFSLDEHDNVFFDVSNVIYYS